MAPSPLLAVLADALYEPATGETQSGVTVLIEDGRILRSGPRDAVAVPAHAVRVDAEGLTLLPGLIDCHVHLCATGEGIDLGARLAEPPSLTVLQAVASCRRTLEAGFTTVRDAGATPAGVRMAVERGLFAGPRMLLAIQILSQTGGHSDSHFPCGVTLGSNPASELPEPVVDGVEPMRRRVRELIRAGADWIKICTSGGVLSLGDAPHHAAFTPAEIEAAVTEAAAQGRLVMAHAHAGDGVKNALRAGVATIEHGVWIDDDACELFLDRAATLVPTLVAPRWVIRHAEAGRMPAWAADKGRAVVDAHVESVRRAVAAGVVVAFGTDTGVGPHGSMGEEFKLLGEVGLGPEDCIRAATSVAARVLGLEGRAGTLAAGAFGDLIGVPGEPVRDLELLARPDNIRLVVARGQVVKAPR